MRTAVSLLDELLPPGTSCAEAFDDSGSRAEDLYPAERAAVAAARRVRRQEFTTGRACARRALAGLGIAPAPLPRGGDGAPVWPPGVVGAITHCAGYRAAAVSGDLAGLGIDAEPHERLPPEVRHEVCLPEERAALRALDASRPEVHWDRLLFSAKESVYKVWSPLTGQWLGFDEAEITFAEDPATGGDGTTARGTFLARLRRPAGPFGPQGPSVIGGRWRVTAGQILTAAVAPPPR